MKKGRTCTGRKTKNADSVARKKKLYGICYTSVRKGRKKNEQERPFLATMDVDWGG